jgi:hypothetical protein
VTGTTKLESLLIKEISGVSDPANESPGWAVCKARIIKAAPESAPDLEHFEKAIKLIVREENAEAVAKAIEAVTKTYSEVLEAALNRIEALETRSATRKSLEGQDSDPGTAPVVKSATEQLGDHLFQMGRATVGASPTER